MAKNNTHLLDHNSLGQKSRKTWQGFHVTRLNQRGQSGSCLLIYTLRFSSRLPTTNGILRLFGVVDLNLFFWWQLVSSYRLLSGPFQVAASCKL